MKTLKEKVHEDNRQQREAKKKAQAELFKPYNKPKVFEFKRNVNMERYFDFPKLFFEWKPMNNAAIALYPVICSVADFEQDIWFKLPKEKIAKMAGINPGSINRGAGNLMRYILDGKPLLDRKMKTEDKRHYYIYRIGFIRKYMLEEYKGQYFSFHTCIIDSGIWADLSSRAKALYIALRSVAKFEPQEYALIEMDGANVCDMDFDFHGEAYRNRKWDFCMMSMAELCRIVHITPNNIKEVIHQLEYHHLIECLDNGMFKVFLKPKIRINKSAGNSENDMFDMRKEYD